MSRTSGFGLLVVGVFLVIVGWLVQSSIFAWLLDIAGVLIIIGGAVVGVIGIVKMFTGGGRSDDF